MNNDEHAIASRAKRKYEMHSDKTRAYIVKLHEQQYSYTQIAALTTVPRSTLRSIIARWHDDGRIKKRRRGGNHKCVISDAVNYCIDRIQCDDPAARLRDIQRDIGDTFISRSPSLSSIHRRLRLCGYTTKQMVMHARPRNTFMMKARRKQWCTEVGASLTPNTVVFIDESPFSFCIIRSRGRSQRGEDAVSITPQIRGKNHSVIAAMSPTLGLIHWEIKVTEPDFEFLSKRKGSKKKRTGPKGVTREVFRSFLIRLFDKLADAAPSQPFTLVMDNCAIHLGDIRDTIFQVGHTQQLLPAWSPALNPIEYTFSKWKLAYRAHHVRSEGSVDPAVEAAASTITTRDCRRWFDHTQKLYAKCQAMENI